MFLHGLSLRNKRCSCLNTPRTRHPETQGARLSSAPPRRFLSKRRFKQSSKGCEGQLSGSGIKPSSHRHRIIKFIMGLLSSRSSSITSSISETAPFGEVDVVMDLPDSYVHSDLGLLESGRFSDFSINCKHRTWHVHSLIVCSRSGWFEQAMNNISEDSQGRIVSIPEGSPDEIDSLLRFIYSGDFSLTHWATAENPYAAACEAFYLADKYTVELLKRPALKQIAIQTRHRVPGDSSEVKFIEAVKLEYHGSNLPQKALRQLFMLEAVRSRGRYRANWQGIFTDEGLDKHGVPRFKQQVRKLENMLIDSEGGDTAVAKMLRGKYNFVSEEASHALWLRDFPPQGRII